MIKYGAYIADNLLILIDPTVI